MIDCWPADVTPSDLAWSDTNIAEISLVLNMSKAIEFGPTGSNSQYATDINGFDASPSTFDNAWDAHKSSGGHGLGTGFGPSPK